ncbi:maleylpyruvate isomerase family mycothiol-dependent enzyme [Nonomuraea sp. NEAU-A123]|uniref:maleylpyruvate isomerase family mycothiol-dependent enzyme n=1 Tax=Nonomuraea sp. NEAU-A123 TaxID=2839649 RepID=UPI001BE4818D|nr:maleylpyruvate isomerase family mycothiol-dependent enzyme [Nonomuraea sp. NEAU-A123]MBT2234943.1 maleylpyruvate isomerase family mycothiol-dependent enzyme [Nonomuraea sp. NEAU-A123]
MDATRLMTCLADEYALLRAAVSAAPDVAPVPSCPGWTVADLVAHVTEVYLHKAETMLRGEWPTPWPPDLSGEEPLAALDRSYAELVTEFAARVPDEYALTWYEPDQSVGFWIRRMAQETVIHRVDAELAAGLPVTPAAADLALDGVDEGLKVMLAYDFARYPEDFAEAVRDDPKGTAIAVVGGERAWLVRPSPTEVAVEDETADRAVEQAETVVSGAPDELLRWVWGRGGEVSVTGDPRHAAYLRKLVSLATQ